MMCIVEHVDFKSSDCGMYASTTSLQGHSITLHVEQTSVLAEPVEPQKQLPPFYKYMHTDTHKQYTRNTYAHMRAHNTHARWTRTRKTVEAIIHTRWHNNRKKYEAKQNKKNPQK